MTTTELHDSELGCKEYWDNAYVKELANFQNNDEDHGKWDYYFIFIELPTHPIPSPTSPKKPNFPDHFLTSTLL